MLHWPRRKRGRLKFVVTLAALAAGLILAAAAQGASCGGLLQPKCPEPALYPPAGDPGGDAAADVSVPPPAGKFFGFNTNLWWQTSNGRSQVPFEVGRSAQAGAQVLRTTVTWSGFASSPENPLGEEGRRYPQRGTVPDASALQRLDELYDRAAARGITLDLIINNAPKWASAYSSCKSQLGTYPSRCAPIAQGKRLYPTATHLVDLSNFIAALGNRYPGAIFETWNEPNLDRGPQAVSGSFMGQMQCAVWRAAKALAQPSLVLTAAFGDFYGEAQTLQYMRGFYSTATGCFDRLSVHTYNGSATSFGANSPLAGHMAIYRAARAEAGDTSPIWVTEFGFTTDPDDDTAVSEREQSDLTRQEYNKLLTMPDIEAALVHTLRDNAPSSLLDARGGYGWIRDGGSFKPVYCAFTARAGTPAC